MGILVVDVIEIEIQEKGCLLRLKKDLGDSPEFQLAACYDIDLTSMRIDYKTMHFYVRW